MKKAIIIVLFLRASCFFAQSSETIHPPQNLKIKAPVQSTVANLPSLDLYGMIPVKDCGGGAGFNVLSKPFNIGYWDPNSPFQVRFGGEFYFSELHHKNMGVLPLMAPKTGDAKVRLYDDVFGLNAMARFSLPYSEKVTPYLDVFGGLRCFSANMSISPITTSPNKTSNSDNLSTTAHFNYGATLGLLISLGEWVKLNTGIMYTYSDSNGEIVNIRKAYVESGTIIADKMRTPNGLFIAKVGFTFFLEDSHSTHKSSSRGGGVHMGTFGGGGGSPSHVNFSVRPSK